MDDIRGFAVHIFRTFFPYLSIARTPCDRPVLQTEGQRSNGFRCAPTCCRGARQGSKGSGPANAFDGYWNDPQATEESLRAGWYHTGDLLRRGEGNDLWFISRKKDIIIRGGTNISPVEVEQALVVSHPAVEQAAVVGIPDAVLGQRVFGLVKLADETKDTVLSESLRNVAARLASYKV
jgi:acyl-coenzyme A synthetase/AMP-(fatty) acid ligase